MTSLGFKKLTEDNWLEPDEILKSFVRLTPDGQSRSIAEEEHLGYILRPVLIESTPSEVKGLFEVARGAMAYGFFFYPLYTLASEQLFRVAEAAVAHKCRSMRAPEKARTFKQRIDWLLERGAVPKSEATRWDAIRKLRNSASHPDRQSILTPGNGMRLLEDIARQINLLFNST